MGGGLLSVSLDEASGMVPMPAPSLEGMWDKAKRLLRSPDDIQMAPGNTSARMVASSSDGPPHYVCLKKGRCECDQTCPHFQAVGLCAHSVAVAELLGSLHSTLEAVSRMNKVSITKLAKHNLPSGAGRKGGKSP